MLVKLYELPALASVLEQQRVKGIDIRRPMPAEKPFVLKWITDHFYPHWMGECDVAFARQPISCFIAVERDNMLGFACYDATCANFFGPTGVDRPQRGRGIGKALLLACLHAMADQGYAYGIIGGVGPVDFYHKTVGAVVIADSTPGIYREPLGSEAEGSEN